MAKNLPILCSSVFCGIDIGSDEIVYLAQKILSQGLKE